MKPNKKTRTLNLPKDSLKSLTTEQLEGVVGGAFPYGGSPTPYQ